MQLFHQTNVPANQNLLYKTAEDAKNAICGNLDMYLNEDTGFIYNKAFDSSLMNYSEEYNNNQYFSGYFSAYIDEQIEWLTAKFMLEASLQKQKTITIVEVGCGKGYYSKKIAEKLPLCNVYGFDTSYEQGAEENPSNLHFYKEYYNGNYAHLNPDIIICRHVIEHIQKPLDFLAEIRASMPENALLFLETPDVNWILKNNVIYDFFYEHCSYFNPSSIGNILSMSGFEPVETKLAFDGQYMWIVARATAIKSEQFKDNKDIVTLCNNYINNREQKMSEILNYIKIFVQEGKTVFVWGAGAKGVTFVNLFDQQQKYISALIDINPSKQEKFVGVTAHKVLSVENAILNYERVVIIILNKNYFNEIENSIKNINPFNKIQLFTIT